VLAWMSGPSYETKAEINMLRKIGADAVSMSVIPEVIVAVQHNVRVAGIALITNMSTGITGSRLSHNEVLKMTSRSIPKFSAFLRKLCAHICTAI
jgi:purine-nucleoside phosphorylase